MSDDAQDRKRSKLLSRALRAVRAIRKADSRDLAKALGLSLRGYQHFEAGGGQLNVDHVMRFSAKIDCDPIGVLSAVQIGKPEFAAWVAQNKAMIAFMMTLQEFAEDTGEAMARLETTTWVSAYQEMFKGLSDKALAAKAHNDAWMAQNATRLGLGARGSGADEENPDDGSDPEEGAASDDADDPEPSDGGS